MERWKRAMNEIKKIDYITSFFRMFSCFTIIIVMTVTDDDWSIIEKIWYVALWSIIIIGIVFLVARFSKDNIPIFEETPDAMILHWAILAAICVVILLTAGISHFIVLL